MKRPDPQQGGLFGLAPARAADELPGQGFLPQVPPFPMFDPERYIEALRHVEAITCAECDGTLYVCQCADVDELMQPFCACGRVWSRCDGSRKGCR